MSEFQESLYPILGVDRSTPADRQEDGKCYAIENLVPVGPEDDWYWSVVKDAVEEGSFTGILSLGKQTREELGPLNTQATDANGPSGLDRLVALKADGVYVIDPTQQFAEHKLYSFAQSDQTRRATFSVVGESTFIAVTSGSGVGSRETLLELRGDSVQPVQWPALPLFSVEEIQKPRVGPPFFDVDNDGVFGQEPHQFRFAWELEDGTIGPASEPVRLYPTTAFKARIRVERFPQTLSDLWEQRIQNLVVIAHRGSRTNREKEGADGQDFYISPTLPVQPEEQPGRVVKRVKDFDVGDVFKVGANSEELAAKELYEGVGLRSHKVIAGTSYGYNNRLILGDTSYDLYRPPLDRFVKWEDGVQNDGGDDDWLLMRVTIKTRFGDRKRLIGPLPFDDTAIQHVEFRSGQIAYNDPRAKSFDFFFSTDYSGDISAATWNRVAMNGTQRRFTDVAGSEFSFATVQGGEPYDMTNQGDSRVDPFKHRFFEESGDTDSAYLLVGTSTSNNETVENDQEDEYVFELENLFPEGDEHIPDFDFDIYHEVEIIDDSGNTNYAEGNTDVTVELRQKDGTVLKSVNKTFSADYTNDGDGTFSRTDKITWSRSTISGWDTGDAYDVRIVIYNTSESNDGGDDDLGTACDVKAEVRNGSVKIAQNVTLGSESLSAGGKNDTNPVRVIWSRPNQPVNFPAENVAYAGENTADPVLGMRALGQAISEGQFGQYPILVCNRQSVRVMEVGQNPFIQSIDVLTDSTGLVGRRAITNVDGNVAAALDTGVFIFTPNIQRPAISDELHDVRNEFLGSLDSDTTLIYYNGKDRGRRELWVGAKTRLWCFSTKHGMWSSLDRDRKAFTNLNRTYYGVSGADALFDEASAENQIPYTIVTGLNHFGPPGYMERLKTLYFQQRFMFESLTWKLVTKDPNASQALKSDPLNRATLPDGLTARDLLPNVLIDSGTLNRGDLGSPRLASGIGYSWFLRMEGQGEPDQGIEGYGAEYQKRQQVRPAAFFPDQPQTVILRFNANPDNNDLNVELVAKDQRGGNDFRDIAAVLWGDGTSDSTTPYYHEYDSTGTYGIQWIAQPDFTACGYLEYAGYIDLSTIDHGDATDLTWLKFSDISNSPFGGAMKNELKPKAIPSTLETIQGGGRPKVSLDTVSPVPEIRMGSGTKIYGNFGNLGTHRIFEIGRSKNSFSGLLDGSPFDQNTTIIQINRIDGGFDLDISKSSGIPSTAVNATQISYRQLKISNLGTVTGTIEETLENCPDLERFQLQRTRLRQGSDFRGAGLIHGNLNDLPARETTIEYPPDDLSQASGMTRLVFTKDNDNNDGGKFVGGADAFIDQAYQYRDTALAQDARFIVDEENNGQVRSSRSDVAYDQLLGLGSYHPANGGSPIIDRPVNTQLRNGIFAVIDSLDFTNEIVRFTYNFQKTPGQYNFGIYSDRVASGALEFDEGDNNATEWTEWIYDGSGSGHPQHGQQFRLLGPSLQDWGLYRVKNYTVVSTGTDGSGITDKATLDVEVETDSNVTGNGVRNSLDSNATTDAEFITYAQPETSK